MSQDFLYFCPHFSHSFKLDGVTVSWEFEVIKLRLSTLNVSYGTSSYCCITYNIELWGEVRIKREV